MRRTPCLVAAITAAVLGVTLVPSASAEAPRLKTVAKPPAGTYLGMLVAPAKNDVWAFGSAKTPVAYHWNGRKWARVALPRGLRGDLGVASASSPRDVWAAALQSDAGPIRLRDLRESPTQPDLSSTVVRWDGRRWTTVKTWKNLAVREIAAVGPRDVWASGFNPGTGRSTTLRFNGRTWATVRTPLQVDQFSVRSAKDVWAIGDSLKGHRATLARYDGERWRTVDLDRVLPRDPARPGGSPAESVSFDGLTAAKGGVWVTGTFYGAKAEYSFVLRQAGRGWKAERVPGVLAHGARPVPDVRGGGVTFPGRRRQILAPFRESALLHRSASGRWTRQVPKVNGRHVELADLVRLPGTATLWSAGWVLKSGPTPYYNALFSYGPTA